MDYDDRLAAIADELPGFAGFFYESPGQLVVQLKDVSRLSEARDKVGEFLWSQAQGNAVIAAEYSRLVDQVTAQHVKYDFRELHDWYRQIIKEFFGVPGGKSDLDDIKLVSGDIDEVQNRIVIGVRDEDDVGVVMEKAKELGVPSDAVLVERIPGEWRTTSSLQGTVRPVVGGVQVGWTGENCTLGYNVFNSNSNDWYFVTASHCTSAQSDSSGDNFGQPTWSSKIGEEVADPKWLDHDDDEDCLVGYECRYSDAALFKYTTSNWTHGYIAYPSSDGSIYFSSNLRIDSDGVPVTWLPVHMVGRTSGRQSGTVISTCEDIFITSPDSIGMLCQATASYPADSGDSGGPVIWRLSGTYTVAVGIHWGYNAETETSAFSLQPLWRSELGEEVGGTLYTSISYSPPPTVTIDGPSIVHPDWSCYWTASGSSGVPPYSYSWSGVLSGTGSMVMGSVSSSGDLRVDVEDDVGHTGHVYKWITVSESAPYHPNCAE